MPRTILEAMAMGGQLLRQMFLDVEKQLMTVLMGSK